MMRNRRTRLMWLAITVGLVLHLVGLAGAWREVRRDNSGRDFASYHYAVQVAVEGGDPYDKAALGRQAREEGTRKGVHPFFYPPPFLLGMAWTAPLSLGDAYRTWFWLDELMGLLAFSGLAWSWRRLDPVVVGSVGLFLGLLTGLPNNHAMGQANLPVMLLVVGGLAAEARQRQGLGGALMGLACMAKMSPAVFVMWWILRRRWKAVVSSLACAVVLSVLTLPIVGLETQWGFFTRVLPGFGSGSYNGLTVGIDLFGNHSLPNLYDAWFPHENGRHLALSDTARRLGSLSFALLLGVMGWAFWRPPADGLARAGQLGAVAATMLLVPVITYEHHLVWGLIPAVALVAGLSAGRLSWWWVWPVAGAVGFWCADLVELKQLSLSLRPSQPMLGWVVQEAKFAALAVFFVASVVLGRSSPVTSSTGSAS